MMSGGGYSALDDPKASGSVPAATGTDPPAIRFAGSNLQTFPPSEARGKIAGAYRPPTDADDTFSSKGGGAGSGGRGGSAGSDDAAQGGWFRMFSVAAYKPYFDVDTSDVVERIWESVFPFRGTFTEKTSENPDLYGPFWTCTTLIFVAASIATFVTYLSHKWHKKEWNYDINLVTWSAGLFYGYVTFVPLLLYVILKSQVLLSTCWSGAIVVPIWILSVHLHSSIASVYCANKNIQMGDCWCCWFHVCYLCCCKSPCAHCKFWRGIVPDRCRDILVAVGACCFAETLFRHDNCIGLFTSIYACTSQEYTQFSMLSGVASMFIEH